MYIHLFLLDYISFGKVEMMVFLIFVILKLYKIPVTSYVHHVLEQINDLGQGSVY